MIKDLLICVFSSLNILLFSFIGLNYEAFKKVNHYQAAAKEFPEFDHLVWNIIHRLGKPVPSQNPETLRGSVETTTTKSLFLSIPKLNILSPIYLPQNSEAIDESLQKGIVSLTPFLKPEHPGQNILFGHSSDYPWNNNPFGTIFTLLPKLENGDEILITRGEELVRYQVLSTSITDPQLSGLVGNTDQHQLILSTCYPIGFFSKRYNVIATPINPT
ncbi:MAG: sortase [Candidatus Altimarinota bacterium]